MSYPTQISSSVLELKSIEEVVSASVVIPVKTGIQKSLKSPDSRSRYPGL
jgi:hypothetical protein